MLFVDIALVNPFYSKLKMVVNKTFFFNYQSMILSIIATLSLKGWDSDFEVSIFKILKVATNETSTLH